MGANFNVSNIELPPRESETEEQEQRKTGAEAKQRKENLPLIKELDGSFKVRINRALSPEWRLSVNPVSTQDIAALREAFLEIPKKQETPSIEHLRSAIESGDENLTHDAVSEAREAVEQTDDKLRGLEQLSNYLVGLCDGNSIMSEGQTTRLAQFTPEAVTFLEQRIPNEFKSNEYNSQTDLIPDSSIRYMFAISPSDASGLLDIYRNFGENISGKCIEKDWGVLMNFNGINIAFIYPENNHSQDSVADSGDAKEENTTPNDSDELEQKKNI